MSVASKAKAQDLSVLSKITGDFAGALHGQIGASNAENVVFSPFSVHCALAMTLAGAVNATAAEMMNALKIGDAQKYAAIQKQYSAFLSAIESIQSEAAGKVEIGIANRIYAQNAGGLADQFVAITTEAFHSPVQPANFIEDSEGERAKINAFVENTTKGLIKDLLAKGLLTELTRLVLVNAIYFKGQWKTKFDKQRTRDADFYLSEGKETCKYKAMTISKEKFRGNTRVNIDGVHFESLSMPYQGGFSMVFLLPANSAAAMAALEGKLVEHGAGGLLDKVLATHGERKYDTVVIPRCKIEFAATLNDPLKALGMKLAFQDGQADFSGMQKPPQEPLSISLVVHKAFMKIDEEGTEAAAATAVVVRTRCAVVQTDKTEFIVNRPYLAFLVHDASRVVLFSAKINRPIDG